MIKTTVKIKTKYIYAYIIIDSEKHIGYVKIGETTRKNPEKRILEQAKSTTDRYTIKILWIEEAKFVDGGTFNDKVFHKYLRNQKNRKQSKYNEDLKFGDEWFYYGDQIHLAHRDFKDFVNHIYLKREDDDIINDSPYTLRKEQQQCSDMVVKKMENGGNKFMINAKPRFGKTLTTYDIMTRSKAKKTLILTNRPAISNSWYDDYKKFIRDNNDYLFISTAYTLKDKNVISYEEFKMQDQTDNMIAFISLQDLKGSTHFGGIYDKLKWVKDVDWDLLILDEAHEGVDTIITQVALKSLNKDFTIHLSGTPFKALANKKFKEDEIFNWTYQDEQLAKENWNEDNGPNPYESMPTLNLFVYQMSNMITSTINSFDESKYFDLTEFFKTEKINGKPKLIYEKEILEWIKTLTTNEKYPFSTKDLRNELKHTLWLLQNVDSAKALAEILRNDPVFENYKIVVAAGDGKVDNTEKIIKDDFTRVRKAIDNNEKTITLSVGKLTTGITMPEWTGILMLSNTTSASFYMQSAFRCQNPWVYEENDKTYMKNNSYIYDFAPERALTIYDKIANNLSNIKVEKESDRKENISILKNFFPVIGEDNDGFMEEFDVETIISRPKEIYSKKVVENGFVSDLLFSDFKTIDDKLIEMIDGLDNQKGKTSYEELEFKDLDKKEKLLSDKIYEQIEKEVKEIDDIKSKINNLIVAPLMDITKKYDLSKSVIKSIINKYTKELEKEIKMEEKRFSIENQEFNINNALNIIKLNTDPIIENVLKDIRSEIIKNKEIEQQRIAKEKLKGLTRTIPAYLMAYGDYEMNLNNFEKKVSDDIFKETTGINKDEFKILRDDYEMFDESIFNQSIIDFLDLKEKLKNYFESDRNIFDYIPNPKTNQIFTPRELVVKMLDELEYNDPNIFKDKNKTFADLYMKSGIFITEIVKRLYKNLEKDIIDDKERLKHILENQVYGFAPNQVIKDISDEYIFGFINDIDKSNFIKLDITDYLTNNIPLDKKLKEVFKKEGNMKFDVIVGNPPYQENDNGIRDDGSKNPSAKPLYHHFVYGAIDMSNEAINLVIPARWLSGAGKGLNKFTKDMLNNKHIRTIDIYTDERALFENTVIKGGVLYMTYDHNYEGDCKISITDSNGNKTERNGSLNLGDLDIFVPYKEIISIYNKIQTKTNIEKNNLSNIVSTQKPFGIRTDAFYNPEKYNLNKQIFNNRKSKDDIEILGLENKKRVKKYLPKDFNFSKGNDLVDGWKLFVPAVSKSGKFGESASKNEIGKPNEVCTETFLVIGSFDSQYEVYSLDKYYKTKFFRCLLSTLKNTQNVSRKVYKLIPTEDFSKDSDIDWNKSIKEIDEQLYKKYELSDEEIKFIEDNVKAMD